MIDLSPELILKAYACGVFPMAENKDDPSVFWVDPDFRGVIPLEEFHLSRRLARTVRSGKFQVSVDQAFDSVIRKCSERTQKREESWINDSIIEVYSELHRRGNAHSVECWSGDELVGGLYGVSLGAAFFGESMFSRASDASKVALVHLIERLRAGDWEHEWGSQTVTAQNPVLAGVLAQMTMGAPFQGFNGGLLNARVRYFDPEGQRPGLPQGVAALVERLEAERTVLQLANTSSAERRVIVQAGGYGEHSFTTVTHEGGCAEVGDRYLEVVLPAGACTRLELGTCCNVNAPTYAFPEGIGTPA